jgi:hypothetical protein
MIKVCIADNYPIFWAKSYLKIKEISIVANAGTWWWDILLTKEIDVLVIDLELVFQYFWGQNTLEKFSKTKIIILVVFRTNLCSKCY